MPALLLRTLKSLRRRAASAKSRAFPPSLSGGTGGAPDRRLLAAVLVLVVAGNAAGAMIVEIVAGRMLAPYFGMSLYTWTTVIGVVLSGLAIGHWAGGRIADGYPEQRAVALGLACLAGALATILILPVVGLVAGSLSLSGVPASTAIVVSGFAAFLIPSVTAGLVQPIATTFALEALGKSAGRIVGRMLAAGVVGAIFGTFLAGFVLVSYLGTAGSIWLVAALNALLGVMLVTAARHRAAGWGLFGIAAAFAATGTALPGFAAPCDVESRYYCIAVFSGDERNLPTARMLRLDALMHSVNDADPQYLAFSHLQWMDELVQQRFAAAPFSSFFIGGGGYTLPRTWLDRNPQNDITIAELDPLVTSIARTRMWFDPGPATTILHMDARLALARLPEGREFDVIVGDAFRDIALPAHLITDEFHRLVRQRLAADGVYVLNVIDAVRSRRLVGSVIETLQNRFAVVEVWYDTTAYQISDSINFIIYAASRPSGLASPLVSRAAPRTRWAQFASEAIDDVPGTILLTDDLAPVERLLAH